MFGTNAIHANFSVDDLAAAREFYVDKMGFSVIKELEGQLILGAGNGTTINIYEKEDHEPWNSTVLGIETDDVEVAVKKLQDAGIEMAEVENADENGIVHDPDLGDAVWFQDPAKNWICVSNIV